MRYKTSDVIALAVADPRYLAPWSGITCDTEPFLCNMIAKLHKEGHITQMEAVKARSTIEDAISNNCTLFSFLSRNRVSGFRAGACDVPRQPNDIRIQFWAMLCMRLKAQGK